MTTYSLLKAGKEWKARKKGTRLDRALTALTALGGKATSKEIADYLEERKLLAGSEMDTREAVSWMLGYAVRLGLLSPKGEPMKEYELFLRLGSEKVYAANPRDSTDFREWLLRLSEIAARSATLEEFFGRL